MLSTTGKRQGFTGRSQMRLGAAPCATAAAAERLCSGCVAPAGSPQSPPPVTGRGWRLQTPAGWAGVDKGQWRTGREPVTLASMDAERAQRRRHRMPNTVPVCQQGAPHLLVVWHGPELGDVSKALREGHLHCAAVQRTHDQRVVNHRADGALKAGSAVVATEAAEAGFSGSKSWAGAMAPMQYYRPHSRSHKPRVERAKSALRRAQGFC